MAAQPLNNINSLNSPTINVYFRPFVVHHVFPRKSDHTHPYLFYYIHCRSHSRDVVAAHVASQRPVAVAASVYEALIVAAHDQVTAAEAKDLEKTWHNF